MNLDLRQNTRTILLLVGICALAPQVMAADLCATAAGQAALTYARDTSGYYLVRPFGDITNIDKFTYSVAVSCVGEAGSAVLVYDVKVSDADTCTGFVVTPARR